MAARVIARTKYPSEMRHSKKLANHHIHGIAVSAGRYSLARVQNPIAPHAVTDYLAITFFQTNGAT